ncbi:unnamed protein product [Scytosiphon promiscuus]
MSGDGEEDEEDEEAGADEGGEDYPGEDDEDDYDDDDDDDDVLPEDVPDEEKTPVTVVTGFLGAGKTTLVNYILKEQREMKIAVIENEFGAVSIDTALVEENVRETEDIITMDNGCVCCTVRGDLVKALLNFLDRRDTFDCILLETTGIADPSPIVATFNQDPDVKANYRIDSVLCLVDAKNILRQLERKAANEEEDAINEAVQQLAFADSVIINKTDLVDEKELGAVKAKIKSVNAFAKVVEAKKSRVPLKSVLNLNSFNLERTLELLDAEAKEEAAREERKKAEEEAAAAAAKAAAEAAEKEKACTKGCCSHKHSDGHHDHEHDDKDAANGHSHDHEHAPEGGEKRKRDREESGDGAATAKKKKPKELVRISATRHDSQVGSLALTLAGSLDVDIFNKFMQAFVVENSANLFRFKGVLSFKDQKPKFVFQGVHEQVICEPSKTHWAEDGSDRESKIVFIGLNLDKEYISEKLKECIVSTEA